MRRWVLLIITVLLFTYLLPAPSALGQPNVCGIYGAITVDGQPVEDGTVLSAYVWGGPVEQITTENSNYYITLAGDYQDSMIYFAVDDPQVPVVETYDWDAGKLSQVDLHAYTGNTGPAACGYYGRVIIDGEPAPAGTTVCARINGEEVACTTTAMYGSNAVYSLLIAHENPISGYQGKLIGFDVDESETDVGTVWWVGGTYRYLDLVCGWSISNYDLNRNGEIDYSEMVTALMDYLLGDVSYSQMVEVLTDYIMS